MPSQALTASLTADDSRTCPSPHLVLYDGRCPLCHRVVRFLLRADPDRRLCFAPLQGETGARVRDYHGFPDDLGTLVYVRDFGMSSEQVLFKSSAVLGPLADLGFVWWVLSVLRVVPRPLRDLLYDWVARNRSRWFGRYDSCPLPSPAERSRFLP